MAVKLAYVISFVDDVEGATAFYRDTLGLSPRLQTPDWVEFDTGPTILALHRADARNPSGTTQLGLGAPDVGALHRELSQRGVKFTREPTAQHGHVLAEFVAPGGGRVGLSGPESVPHAKDPSKPLAHHPNFFKLADEAKARTQQLTAQGLTELRERGPVVVIDVREDAEWKRGHLPGALHLSRGVLEQKIADQIPDFDTQLVVYCGGGNRSALAADSLQKFGYARVASLIGGYLAWQAAGLPTES